MLNHITTKFDRNRRNVTEDFRSYHILFTTHYNDIISDFWRAGEIRYNNTMYKEYHQLSKEKKRVLEYTLSIFAILDSYVSEHIGSVSTDIKELQALWAAQSVQEWEHAITYGEMLKHIWKNKNERDDIRSIVDTSPAILKLRNWIKETTKNDKSTNMIIILQIALEGIIFAGYFCNIFWFTQNRLFKPLSEANISISRDENKHAVIWMDIYENFVSNKGKYDNITRNVFEQATELSKGILDEMFDGKDLVTKGVETLTSTKCKQYVEAMSDCMLQRMKIKKVYDVKSPYKFME